MPRSCAACRLLPWLCFSASEMAQSSSSWSRSGACGDGGGPRRPRRCSHARTSSDRIAALSGGRVMLIPSSCSRATDVARKRVAHQQLEGRRRCCPRGRSRAPGCGRGRRRSAGEVAGALAERGSSMTSTESQKKRSASWRPHRAASGQLLAAMIRTSTFRCRDRRWVLSRRPGHPQLGLCLGGRILISSRNRCRCGRLRAVGMVRLRARERPRRWPNSSLHRSRGRAAQLRLNARAPAVGMDSPRDQLPPVPVSRRSGWEYRYRTRPRPLEDAAHRGERLSAVETVVVGRRQWRLSTRSRSSAASSIRWTS
jgi:hypothetical protein